MKKQLDFAKIAWGRGAVRCGRVRAKGGYLGALGLVADIEARSCGPEGRGRSAMEQLGEEEAEGLIRRRRAG